MKTQTPKRIWIRSLANGKVSCAEYIRGKRRNVIEPFTIDNKASHAIMRERIDNFKIFNNNRDIVAMIACDDLNAVRIARILKIPIEK